MEAVASVVILACLFIFLFWPARRSYHVYSAKHANEQFRQQQLLATIRNQRLMNAQSEQLADLMRPLKSKQT